MAQPSIANYFITRKRAAADDPKINRARKVLVLDQDGPKSALRSLVDVGKSARNTDEAEMFNRISNVLKTNKVTSSPSSMTGRKKSVLTPTSKKIKEVAKHGTIEQLFSRISNTVTSETVTSQAEPFQPSTPTKSTYAKDEVNVDGTEGTKEVPQPSTPVKCGNAMDKVKVTGSESTLTELKQKLSRSSRLAELRASMARMKQSEKQLNIAEKRTEQTKDSLSLKNFKAIELEVNLSPQKPQSPQKAYLSPKKNTSVCKNLFNLLSPTKNAVPMPASPSKQSPISVREALALPYKYRRLAEIFRAIDTVCQILYNRKETITFKKLKPAVEEMLKRNLTEKHLAQIKYLYPEAFTLQQEKLREFGTGTRREHWELVLVPQVKQQAMTVDLLLDRRRKLYAILIEKLKDYHQEFLATLNPPMEISRKNITRWHPQFDLEKVPDIETASIPRPPNEEKFTTGSQVLEKARTLFNCNTRMEQALEKLKQSQKTGQITKEEIVEKSVLKGIPKALLEKVRQRQAAKALESMTRSTDKEKEVQLYSQLPEIARLTRNLFVSEKKNVLPLELVLDKLCHSYRVFSNSNQMEAYLKTIAKEESNWLKFEEVRGTVFIKLAKNHDLSLIMSKLKGLADQKMT